MNWLAQLPAIVLPLLFAVTLHEAAHAWVADKKGDDTARKLGRLSLNPIVHIEWFGTIIVPFMLFLLTQGASIFGWARPVPVDARRLRHPKQDMAWVAAAGPGMNLLLALITGVLYRLIPVVGPYFYQLLGTDGAVWFLKPILMMLHFSIHINLLLMVFNLIPIPPLDGGRILAGLLPEKQAGYLHRVEPYGMFLVIFLFYIDPFHVMFRMINPVIRSFSHILFGQ